MRWVLILLLFAFNSAEAQMATRSLGADSLVLIGNNGNTTTMIPSTISTSFTLTLPPDSGVNGQVLQTDGTGVLSWTSPASSGTPAGTIIAFAGSTCPNGYMAANGNAVSRITYSALWTALGQVSSPWGQGDGSTTFNVPDLRNRFLRGTGTNGDGFGGDAVALGSYQGDAFQGHRHQIVGSTGVVSQSSVGPYVANSAGSSILSPYAGLPTSDGSNGTPRTASETRPKSYGILMCIKY